MSWKRLATIGAPIVLLLLILPPYMNWMFNMDPRTLGAGYAMVGLVALAWCAGGWTGYWMFFAPDDK